MEAQSLEHVTTRTCSIMEGVKPAEPRRCLGRQYTSKGSLAVYTAPAQATTSRLIDDVQKRRPNLGSDYRGVYQRRPQDGDEKRSLT